MNSTRGLLSFWDHSLYPVSRVVNKFGTLLLKKALARRPLMSDEMEMCSKEWRISRSLSPIALGD
jgi:hypothetical protein